MPRVCTSAQFEDAAYRARINFDQVTAARCLSYYLVDYRSAGGALFDGLPLDNAVDLSSIRLGESRCPYPVPLRGIIEQNNCGKHVLD